MLVARQHAKVRDARRDVLHTTSTDLVRRFDADRRRGAGSGEHGQEPVPGRHGDQPFGVGPVLRPADLPGAALRPAPWSWWTGSTRAARPVRRAGTCSPLLSLGTRQWTCPGCGARHDRGINAAKNILAAGRSVARKGDACGGDVRGHGPTRRQTPAKHRTLRRERREPPSLPAGSGQVHHPTPSGVRPDPLDRFVVQVHQRRRVRQRIRLGHGHRGHRRRTVTTRQTRLTGHV